MLLVILNALFLCFHSVRSITLNHDDIKFEQTIMAVGIPFYKMMMTLGTCKERVVFEEQKAFSKAVLNRVLDIYYISSNPDITVSKVEIYVVLNNTDCSVYTKNGVGHSDFSATMYIPTHVSCIFYHLYIYTCSRITSDDNSNRQDNSEEKKEEDNILKLPFYLRPIRPDRLPHNIIFGNETIIEEDLNDNPNINTSSDNGMVLRYAYPEIPTPHTSIVEDGRKANDDENITLTIKTETSEEISSER